MRRFRFRLGRVLKYRESREQIAYHALQDAIRQRVQHEEQIRQLKHQIEQMASERLSPHEWKRREALLSALHTRLQTLSDALPLLIEQEERARAVYLQARQEREALTRLHQRAYAHYQTELQRALQSQMDEVVAVAYQRTVSENASEGSGNPRSHRPSAGETTL